MSVSTASLIVQHRVSTAYAHNGESCIDSIASFAATQIVMISLFAIRNQGGWQNELF